MFIEKRTRGGISYIAKRLSKANNKYIQYYDDKKSSKYIKYLDANNLHDWAMSMANLNSLIKKETDQFYLNSISKNTSDGYILEVDLGYPDKLHELHNDYPLAPKVLEINHNMLSKYCSNISNKYDIKIGGN